MRSWCEESAENRAWALGELLEELRKDCRQHCGPLEAKKQREHIVKLAIFRSAME